MSPVIGSCFAAENAQSHTKAVVTGKTRTANIKFRIL